MILIVVALLGVGVPWIMVSIVSMRCSIGIENHCVEVITNVPLILIQSCIRGDDVPQGTEERDGGDGSATV